MLMTARAGGVSDRKLLGVLLGALIGLAWLALWIWGQSPYTRYLSHHSLEEVRGGGLLLLVFVAGWLLMVVAMMLPTSLPLVGLFHALAREARMATRLSARPGPRAVLPGLLLVADAGKVRRWGGQPGLDAAARRGHGRREERAWGRRLSASLGGALLGAAFSLGILQVLA
jgi:predicted metal-binding membrane protein